jgi:pentatricopeptide repeat protein
MFIDMKDAGITPTVVCYNAMIDALGKNGQLLEMKQMFSDMNDAKITSNVFTYTAMIDALGKNGQLREMNQMFKDMKDARITPDDRSYNAMIDAFGKNGQLREMKQMFSDMSSAKIAPTVFSYNSMIDALGKHGQLPEMTQMFRDMKNAGIAADEVTYYSLIDSLEANDEIKLVDEFLANATVIKLLEKYQHESGHDDFCPHFYPAQSKELYMNLHGLTVGLCRGVLRRALHLADDLKGSGKVVTVVVGKGLHTENVKVLADGSTTSVGGGEGGIIGPSLLKYLKEELVCDCVVDPNNAGRILITL